MRADEFFFEQDIQLPLTRKTSDFKQYISEVMGKYLVILEKINDNDIASKYVDENVDKAKNLSQSIIDAVSIYLEGHPYDAYDKLNQTLDSLKELLDQLWTPKISDIGTNRLYRMRLNCDVDISRNDIFHVPFEQRHLVSTQRYSIPGLPCLYLGGSLYTCWREMGSPSFEDIHVSSFMVSSGSTLKFLDFSKTPKWIANWLKDGIQLSESQSRFLGAQIVLWPLIAACSIKTLIPKANFKPEHIIPQMLLQWVTKNITEFDGIRYFSTHIDTAIVKNPHWVCNYVLPVKRIESNGYCNALKKSFVFTDPLLWRYLRVINLKGRDPKMRDNFEIEFIPGVKELYGITEFGEMQWKLNCMLHTISL